MYKRKQNFKMPITTSKLLLMTGLLITVGIHASFGNLIPGEIEIHATIYRNTTRTTIPIFHSLDRCIPVIPKSESGNMRIYKIETNENCINIYSRDNCAGKFIRLQTSDVYTNISDMAAHRWDDDVLVANEKMVVTSIGPCLEKCDPQNWAGMRNDILTNVTFYDETDYKGMEYTHSISGKQCVPIKSTDRGRGESRVWRGSIKISGTASTTCVELHRDATCGGESVLLRPGYPYLHELWLWGFDLGHMSAAQARSMSLCGATCPVVEGKFSTTVTTVLEEPVTNQSDFQSHEKVCTCQGEEQPWHSPVWAILLIVLVILLVLCLAGFGGFYLFQKYRSARPLSYQERCNVIYKSQSENL